MTGWLVTGAGGNSNTVTVPVVTAAPGIFLLTATIGAVQNSDFTVNAPGNPAAAGSTIIAYFTGTGPLNPPVPDGAVTPLVQTIVTSPNSATLGGVAATVNFAGMSEGSFGLGQMNIVVPSSLKPGNYPLVITINGQNSNTVQIGVK